MNVVETFVEFPGIILKLFILSDPIFFNLLGALVVLAFLLFFVSLHHIMTRERSKKYTIGNRAEDERCTEYDVFVRAHEFYYGSVLPGENKSCLYNLPQ